MYGPSRIAVILALYASLAATAAVAGPGDPDPPNINCQGPFIHIVGHDGVVGDPLGQFCVTVRDFNNLPVANSSVVIDFSNCNVQLCVDQRDPGALVDCTAQTVRKLTDANGVACFRVIGKRRDPGCSAASSPWAAVFCDGIFVCRLGATVYDLVNESSAGVSGNDLSEFLHLFLDCGVYLPAIDYNANEVSDGDDLSKFLAAFFAGGSALSCSSAPDTKCP